MLSLHCFFLFLTALAKEWTIPATQAPRLWWIFMYRYPLVWLQLYLTNGTYEKLEHISNRILRIQPSRKKCASILKYFLYNIWIHIFSIRMGRRVGWFFLAEHIFEDANSWLLFRKWHGVIFFCYYINDNTSGIIPQSFWLHSCFNNLFSCRLWRKFTWTVKSYFWRQDIPNTITCNNKSASRSR